MAILGLDIGGANLKAADDGGAAHSLPFPLWREPERLAERLGELAAKFSDVRRFAVTITGELADCFRTKAEGIERIVAAVDVVAAGRPVAVWGTDGRFHSPASARQSPMTVAAANWHALGSWVGERFAPTGSALLVDIGTTTADFIPLRDGRPAAHGKTDLERLQHGELLYTGTSRTPLCAVVQTVPLRGQPVPVAAELFATIRDVYLLRGDLPEDPEDCETADGRPATRGHAAERLARMLCADMTELSADEIDRIAAAIATAHASQVQAVLRARINEHAPETIILSGSGSFLSARLLKGNRAQTVLLDEFATPAISLAACAWAVAWLDRGSR